MNGILYAVGVGPGDPKLMTLQAISTINACHYIAVPTKKKEDSIAYRIASKICDLSAKNVIEMDFPMTMNDEQLHRAHMAAAKRLIEVLMKGEGIAFLTLGDPAIFATTAYVTDYVESEGLEVRMVSGIPSFAAAAARINVPLGIKDEQIHIIPASSDLTKACQLDGTKVFMKLGQKKEMLKQLLKASTEKIYVVEKCGMKEEHIYEGIEALDRELSYFSIVIVKA